VSKEEVIKIAACIVMLLLIVGGSIGVKAVDAYFEARAYERVTGKHVSTWDAMFIDLRVQEQAQ
jgi:hypothetical protein